MVNIRMQEKLEESECLDVMKEGEEIEDGLYKLRRFVEDVDYCDAHKEQWIWSIGKEEATGVIYAATDARFYQHPDFECLFLR